MAAYFLLLCFVIGQELLALYLPGDPTVRQKRLLFWDMLLIFLLLALKKETVGIDIAGYKKQYALCAGMPWKDFSYVYFENGYLLLTKLFSKTGVPFQVFNMAVYAFACNAIYRLILKYSTNYTMSVLIFICYQFLVFYISGIRQTIAMSICLNAFFALEARSRLRGWRFPAAVLLVLLAATVHRSSLIFLPVLLICAASRRKPKLGLALGAIALTTVLRSRLLALLNRLAGGVDTASRVTLRGNFLFLVLLTIMGILSLGQKRALSRAEGGPFPGETEESGFAVLTVHLLLAMLLLNVLFSGSSLLRATMYLSLFLIPGIPVIQKRFDCRFGILINLTLTAVFLTLFVVDTLVPNQLNLCPYLFFWQ